MLGSLLASNNGTPGCSLAKETPVRQVMSSNLAAGRYGQHATNHHLDPFGMMKNDVSFTKIFGKKIAAPKKSIEDLDSSDLMGGVSPTKEMGAGGNS